MAKQLYNINIITVTSTTVF